MMHRWFMQSGPGDGHWLAGLALMLVFWAVVALMVLAIVHYVRSNRPVVSNGATSTPADVLKMRLAKGEIDETEFSSRMTALNSHQP